MKVNDSRGCPVCSSVDHLCRGKLGNFIWIRCRDCGVDYAVKPKEEEHGQPSTERDREVRAS